MLITIDSTVNLNGDTWLVQNTGVMRNINGKVETFCHLASTTRFVEQRNGKRAIQVQDWVDGSTYPSDVQFVCKRNTDILLKLVDGVWHERKENEVEWHQASATNQKKYMRFYDEEDGSMSFYNTFSIEELQSDGNEYRRN